MQTFGPTLDHAIKRELDRLAALVGAVENGTVDEGALVVYLDGLLCGRFGTLAGYEHLVLQSGSGLLNALAEFVLRQEFSACLFRLTVFHA